ncbi:MAG TPA: response regulator [Patescibacteria group bacterium]|nr:response regulator [Patescibacteria group bacterium]
MPRNETVRFEVLIVDDEPGDVDLTRLALADGPFSCNVTVAVNGEEAMAILRRHPPHSQAQTPDLVLLDLNMPQMNGREVLAALKADPALSTIPVVVLTTSDVERDVVASYQLGAVGYVTKPLDCDALFQTIRGVEEYWFGIVRRPL